jgi:hypothetical protein
MDPFSLAAAAVALLVPFFRETASGIAERTGEMIAESALPKVKALYARVRAKLGPGSYRGALLDGVQEDPDDTGRQQILKTELAKVIGEDHEFATELARLVNDAQAAGGVQIKADGAGVVAGRDVHQWAGGDVVAGDKVGGDKVGHDKITYAPPPTER